MKSFFKNISFFAAFVAPMGAQFMTVPVGGVQLSLFRIAVILLIFGILVKDKGRIKLYNKGNEYSVCFMLCWLAYALLTVLWARDLANYIRILFFLFVGVLSVVILQNIWDSTKDVIKGLTFLELGFLLQALIGWYEVITRDYHFLSMTATNIRIYVSAVVGTPVAMSGNPNNFATMMFIGFFIAYCLWKQSERQAMKRVHAVIGINFVVLLILANSRANLIALLLGVVFLLFIAEKKKIAAVVAVVTAVVATPRWLPSLEKILAFNFQTTGSSDSVRLNLIKSGLDFLWDTGGFGVGIGQIESWMHTNAQYFVAGGTNMHNWWMEILVGFGIWIFIGYMVFYFRLFTDNYKVMKKTGHEGIPEFSKSICAIMVGFVVASVSASSNMIVEYLWYFWAICIAYQGMMRQSKLT